MKVYLAGKISGYSYEDVVQRIHYQRNVLVSFGYTVFSPMTGKGHLRNETRFRAQYISNNPTSTNHAIFERDKWMVEQADVVFVDLTETKQVSIGSMMEIAWASMLGKHTVVAMEDDNVHRHVFVLEAADVVFTSTNDAINYLKTLSFGEDGL